MRLMYQGLQWAPLFSFKPIVLNDIIIKMALFAIVWVALYVCHAHYAVKACPQPIMFKILPIMLLSSAQIFDLLCSILCSCVHNQS